MLGIFGMNYTPSDIKPGDIFIVEVVDIKYIMYADRYNNYENNITLDCIVLYDYSRKLQTNLGEFVIPGAAHPAYNIINVLEIVYSTKLNEEKEIVFEMLEKFPEYFI